MSHLGRWLSALVDGELEGDERDRVLNHVAGCAGCRQEANAMRALKRRLTALGETSAEPAIASRLIELAWTNQPGADDFDEIIGGPSSGAARTLRPGARLLAAAAGSALATVGALAFLLGSAGSPPAPKVTPSVDSFLLQHAYDAGQATASSAQVSQPAASYRHGSRLAGPALGRPAQFGSGPAAAFAASTGTGAAPGPVTQPAGSGSRAARRSPPVASQHPG